MATTPRSSLTLRERIFITARRTSTAMMCYNTMFIRPSVHPPGFTHRYFV